MPKFESNDGDTTIIPFFNKDYGTEDYGKLIYDSVSTSLRLIASFGVNAAEGMSMFGISLLLQEIPVVNKYLTSSDQKGLFFTRNFQLGYLYYHYFFKHARGIFLTGVAYTGLAEEIIAVIGGKDGLPNFKGVAEGLGFAFILDEFVFGSGKLKYRKTWPIPIALMATQIIVHFIKKK